MDARFGRCHPPFMLYEITKRNRRIIAATEGFVWKRKALCRLPFSANIKKRYAEAKKAIVFAYFFVEFVLVLSLHEILAAECAAANNQPINHKHGLGAASVDRFIC